MHRFEVWAPFPHKVAARVNDATLPMTGPDEHGFWRVEAEDAEPGASYGYILDSDEKCYPDPRSQWQPDGVHGMSRIYGQNLFAWTDNKFQPIPLASAIVSMKCMLEPSPPRARWMLRSAGSIIWSISESPTSNSCPSRPSPEIAAGDTTQCHYSRSMSLMAAPTPSSAS